MGSAKRVRGRYDEPKKAGDSGYRQGPGHRLVGEGQGNRLYVDEIKDYLQQTPKGRSILKGETAFDGDMLLTDTSEGLRLNPAFHAVICGEKGEHVCVHRTDNEKQIIGPIKSKHRERLVAGHKKAKKDVVLSGYEFTDPETGQKNPKGSLDNCWRCGRYTKTNIAANEPELMPICDQCEKKGYIEQSKKDENMWSWTKKLFNATPEVSAYITKEMEYPGKMPKGQIKQGDNMAWVGDIFRQRQNNHLQDVKTKTKYSKKCERCGKIPQIYFEFGRTSALTEVCGACAVKGYVSRQ